MCNRSVISFVITLLLYVPLFSQNPLNDKAENLLGLYEGTQGKMIFRAKIEKEADGTYLGRIVWLNRDKDAHGNLLLDTKNPDRTLRTTPLREVVLFRGLHYDVHHANWRGCKIYDPQRGISAKLTARFADDGRLALTGSLLGISETVYWKKIN